MSRDEILGCKIAPVEGCGLHERTIRSRGANLVGCMISCCHRATRPRARPHLAESEL